ncbi:hypothetical protein GW17_00042061 [Ensete ventricosum]|nr:hypothetical protein GW17_00042061 [Ensete ventricosum]RZR99370.1 hypothetical protein BHM03_00028891 [Ensete ventricosum]
MWIPLERRILDLLHLLHPDLAHTRLQRGVHKGDQLQGSYKGLPPVGVAASAAGVGLPFVGWLPACKGSRRLHRGNSDGGVDVVRGVMASF